MRRAPAWWRCLRAFFTGYFWLSCPRCGEMFAGYEKGGGTLWMYGSASTRTGWVTCPKCPGERLAREYSGYRTNLDVDA